MNIKKIIKKGLMGIGVILILYSLYTGWVLHITIGLLLWLCGLGLKNQK